jgi:hypothetical protein
MFANIAISMSRFGWHFEQISLRFFERIRNGILADCMRSPLNVEAGLKAARSQPKRAMR